MANRNYPKNVTATTTIPFDNPVTAIPVKTITGAVTFNKYTAGAQAGYGAIIRVIANGSNVPDLSAFKSIGSGSYDNTNGVVNQLWFIYDGTDYCVAITQPVTIGGGGGDTTPPTTTTVSVEDAEPNKILIAYSEALDTGSVPATGDYVVTVNGSGRTVTAVSVLTSSVKVTFGGAAVVSTDTIGLNYTAGTNPVQDVAGNNAGNLSGVVVDNNVAASDGSEALIFGSLSGLVNSGGGIWTGAVSGGSSYNNYGLATKKLPSATNGYVKWNISSATNESAMLTFRTDNVASRFDSGGYKAAAWVYLGDIYIIDNAGTPTAVGSTLTAAAGAMLQIIRTGSAIKLQKSTNSGGLWTDVYTYTFSSSADLFINADVDYGQELNNPKGFNVA